MCNDDCWSSMAAVRTKKRTAAAADRLLNRELSFLDYAARVLALAEDAEVPLLERVKFCSICSEMLDEFFMVRVAGLTGQAAAGITVRSPDGRTPKQALSDARERVLELSAAQSQIWTRLLCPALAEQGILPERAPYTVREGGSRLCFVRDPDGYRIEIIERTDG